MLRLIGLVKPLAGFMVLAIAMGLMGHLAASFITIFGGYAAADILGIHTPLSLRAIFICVCVFALVRGVLRYAEQACNHFIAFKLLALIRDKVFRALRRLCPAKLETKQKGAIITMITSDIETLEVFYAHTVSPVCIAVIVSLCVTIFVWRISHPLLALAALCGYVTVGVLLPILSSGRLKASGVRYRAGFSSFSAFFLDSIKGVKEIVLYGAGEEREKEVDRRSDQLLEETKRMKRDTSAAAAATELCVSLFIILSLAAGIYLVARGALTPGRMLIGVTAIFGSLGPVIAISALPGNLTQTLASGDRVLDLLSEQPAVTPVKNGRRFDFDLLDVRNLDFSYDGDARILSDICMHARRGEIIGIIGRSGCGKSTLLKLLLRFWRKSGGEIAYNDTDIEDIDSESLLDNVTLVSQTTYLFDETIEDNLLMARPGASRAELEEACRMASVHDLIMSLPDGYKTRVGALGSGLSAGEKQRIGIARAFLRGSGLILLDEPTSNVDSINEGIILKALRDQKDKKAIILVSHRESTMAIADRIYRIEEGHMHEQC